MSATASLFGVAILAACFLSCAVAEDRARTVRREFSVDEDETTFIKTFESFIDDAEGTSSQAYWPEGSDPLNMFGLMQKVMVSDMLLQMCILSGTYTRPKPPEIPTGGTGGEEPAPSVKKHARQSSVFDDLFRMLRARTVDTSTPPQEDWENDPYDLLEDAEYQFNNLCFTLFELRRLNRKLARQEDATTETPP